jgi:hypothetical protein
MLTVLPSAASAVFDHHTATRIPSMTRFKRSTGGVAVALLLALAPLSGAVAADGTEAGNGGSGASGEAAGNAAGEPVSDAKLEQFAAAFGQMQQVRREYGQKMKQADEQARRKELRKEGQQEMVGAIRGAGLEIAEYRRIGQRLNQDEELRSRLKSMMQEQRGSGQSGSSG